MKVRSLDGEGDWTFGAGTSNYLQANRAIAQNIQTRLKSVIGNCFFDLGAGIDWFNLLGSKQLLSLNLAISSVILQTPGVTGLLQISANLDSNRSYNVSYKVQTVYSVVTSSFVFDKSIGG